MAGKLSEALIQIRAPERLVDALNREAERRTMSKSSLVRLALVRELGLPHSMPGGDQAAQDVKRCE